MNSRLIILALLTMISIMAKAQTKIQLSVGTETMTATLADNDATRALVSKLKNGSVTIDMEEYGGFEKVGPLPWSLPASDRQTTTEPGDIMLYQGRNIVIFYGSNSWSYTPLGRLDGATASNLREFLGNGDTKLTISLITSSGLESVESDDVRNETVYDLNGRLVAERPLPHGVYIVNGKKRLIR